jgi:hypothetical protein
MTENPAEYGRSGRRLATVRERVQEIRGVSRKREADVSRV